MSAGFSQPWQEAIEQLTGAPVMSAESFIKYFLPLYEFLQQENTAAGLCIGWGGQWVLGHYYLYHYHYHYHYIIIIIIIRR